MKESTPKKYMCGTCHAEQGECTCAESGRDAETIEVPPSNEEWIEETAKHIKALLSEALSLGRKQGLERIGEVIDKVWKQMTDRTYIYTMKGKTNYGQVTEEDWANASFTIEELKEKVISTLNEDREI